MCDPANNYGLVWKSGTVGGPLSTTDRAFNIDAAKTAKDCCINCYRTKYCSFFEYAAIPGLAPFCILNENLDGFVTNPVNPTCPYGDAQIDFESGADVLAFGPCAVQKNGPWSWS